MDGQVWNPLGIAKAQMRNSSIMAFKKEQKRQRNPRQDKRYGLK
jgi:hypothetical protein